MYPGVTDGSSSAQPSERMFAFAPLGKQARRLRGLASDSIAIFNMMVIDLDVVDVEIYLHVFTSRIEL